jgi:hypothetical protein
MPGSGHPDRHGRHGPVLGGSGSPERLHPPVRRSQRRALVPMATTGLAELLSLPDSQEDRVIMQSTRRPDLGGGAASRRGPSIIAPCSSGPGVGTARASPAERGGRRKRGPPRCRCRTMAIAGRSRRRFGADGRAGGGRPDGRGDHAQPHRFSANREKDAFEWDWWAGPEPPDG